MFTVTVKPPPSTAPGGFGCGEPARGQTGGECGSTRFEAVHPGLLLADWATVLAVAVFDYAE